MSFEHAISHGVGAQTVPHASNTFCILRGFATGHLLAVQLRDVGKVETAIRSFVVAITIRTDGVEVIFNPNALGIQSDDTWPLCLPLPARGLFREATSPGSMGGGPDRQYFPGLWRISFSWPNGTPICTLDAQ